MIFRLFVRRCGDVFLRLSVRKRSHFRIFVFRRSRRGSGRGIFFFAFNRTEHVRQNTENERAGDRSERHFPKGEGKSAHARNQDDGDHEQIAIFIEVHLLNHFEAGYGDEAVQSDTDAAHDARRNRRKEGDEGSEEGDDDRQTRGH